MYYIFLIVISVTLLHYTTFSLATVLNCEFIFPLPFFNTNNIKPDCHSYIFL